MQDTNYWADSLSRIPSVKYLKPSNPPMLEKAQHEPQFPWFLVGKTAPFYTQSTFIPVGSTCFPPKIIQKIDRI